MKTLLTLAVLMFLASTAVHADVLSDFEDGTLQGWTKDQPFVGNLLVAGAGSHEKTIHAQDTCAGCGALRISAPSPFLGDLTEYVGITWDEYIPDNSTGIAEGNTTVHLHGADGTVFQSINPTRGPLHQWIRRYHSFSESDWVRTKGTSTFLEVLSDVTQLRINLDIGWNEISRDEAYVDNIRLTYTGCKAPWIFMGPAARSVLPGDEVTFSVWAFGSSPLSYQWRYNGTNLTGETGSALTLTDVEVSDEGVYSVIVQNECGQDSASAQLITRCPVITEQSSGSWMLLPGGNVTFTVTADAAIGPLHYQWQFKGSNLPAQTGPTLYLTNVQTDDMGLYRVIVSNTCGSVTSQPVYLGVGCPIIRKHPVSRVVENCSDVLFRVVAESTGPMTYQWQNDGTNLLGATDAELTVASVGPADAGDYQVIVESPCGSVTSAIATLTVECRPPVIIAQPEADAVFPGSNAVLQVTAASSCPLDYQWFYEGLPLISGTSEELVLTNVQTNDGGAYFAIISNTCGAVTSEVAQLYVYGQVTCYSNMVNADGFHLIANQLDRGGNTLDEILPIVPEGTELLKYNNQQEMYETAFYQNGSWHDISTYGWPERLTLSPGEGAWLISPQTFYLTFCGVVSVPELPHPDWPLGGLYSRQEPLSGTWDDIVGASVSVDDQMYIWSGSSYDTYAYIPGIKTAPPRWIPQDPQVDVGEAAFVVPAATGLPPGLNCWPARVLQHPFDQTVECGDPVGFSVAATRWTSEPSVFHYQWYLNDVPLPGATSSNLVIANVSANDVGFYRVTISNECAISRSLLAALSVFDDAPPVITACASNRTLAVDTGCQAMLPDLTGEVAATDNCGSMTLAQAPSAGTMLDLGDTTVVFTAVDGSGNSNTCSALITVADVTPPNLTCPPNIDTPCTDTNGAEVVFDQAGVSDNCDPSPQVVFTPASGSTFAEGTHTVDCLVMDASSNMASCTFLVTVSDPVPALLSIAQTTDQAVVSWPVSCTTFGLEEATTLIQPTNWVPVVSPLQLVDGRYQKVRFMSDDRLVFRLRRGASFELTYDLVADGDQRVRFGVDPDCTFVEATDNSDLYVGPILDDQICRSFLIWDLASLPAGQVTSASVTMYKAANEVASLNEMVNVGIHKVIKPIVEGEITHMEYSAAGPWDHCGGDFERPALATVALNAYTFGEGATPVGTPVTWGTTTGLVAAAQEALDAGSELRLVVKVEDLGVEPGGTGHESETERHLFRLQNREEGTSPPEERPLLTLTILQY